MLTLQEFIRTAPGWVLRVHELQPSRPSSWGRLRIYVRSTSRLYTVFNVKVKPEDTSALIAAPLSPVPTGSNNSAENAVALATTQLMLDRFKPIEPRDFPNPPAYGARFPPTTISNVKFLLEKYDIKLGYNVIKKRLYHAFPGMTIAPDNADNVALTHIVSACMLNSLQSGLIPAYVD